MKKTLPTIFLTIIIILTVLNITFLVELYKNEDLKNFYYNNDQLPNNYTDREKQHMQEVKDLINFFILIDILLIITLTTLKQKINYKKTGIYLISFSILLFIASLFYQQFHHYIHLLLFRSDTWLLPYDSILIQNYPLDYFRTKFITINIIYLIIGIIISFLNKLRLSN